MIILIVIHSFFSFVCFFHSFVCSFILQVLIHSGRVVNSQQKFVQKSIPVVITYSDAKEQREWESTQNQNVGKES